MERGLRLLEKGLEAYRITGAELALPYYLSILTDAGAQMGRFAEARAALNEATTLALRPRIDAWGRHHRLPVGRPGPPRVLPDRRHGTWFGFGSLVRDGNQRDPCGCVIRSRHEAARPGAGSMMKRRSGTAPSDGRRKN
jgi:hypothetical protein